MQQTTQPTRPDTRDMTDGDADLDRPYRRGGPDGPRPDGSDVVTGGSLADDVRDSPATLTPPHLPAFRVTVHTVLPEEHAQTFYPLYLAAFTPLATRAVARQVLTAAEFTAEMTDERVDKYVVWSADGEPIGLSTFTRDLTTVPWISAEYFADRYPQHHARNAIYYLGFTLVHPDHQRGHALVAMLARMGARASADRAVVGYDICAYNNDTRDFASAVARIMSSMAPSEAAVIDTQTYYAMTFDPS